MNPIPNPDRNLTRNPDSSGELLFDHEKLDVYQNSIAFCGWCGEIIENLPKIAARDQLDRASTSVPLNIAEGNAKFSPADRSRFFEMARGSAVECASCLDVLVARKKIDSGMVRSGKEQLAAITRMLIGLLKRFSPRADVLREEQAIYLAESDHDQEHDHDSTK